MTFNRFRQWLGTRLHRVADWLLPAYTVLPPINPSALRDNTTPRRVFIARRAGDWQPEDGYDEDEGPHCP